ncbi:MAG TPA: hypothetical protein VFH61_04265 [Thermoleophilia bacterium]|nr:hypothetical protein [Thermoleophilia bacterium]
MAATLATKPITVRDYADGTVTESLSISTAWGDLEVTGIRLFSDGPWIVTGRGTFHQQSFAVCWDTKLEVIQ